MSSNIKQPLVTIIIVNWNGKSYITDFLTSLSRITYKNYEVIFVDNASIDGSLAYVKKNYPHFTCIENEKNVGYAEGNDIGLRYAQGEFVLLLGTDTIVKENLLDVLVKPMLENKKIGAIMPKLIMYPQKNSIDSVGTFFVMNGITYHFGREKAIDIPKYNVQMEIYGAKGACLLLRKHVIDSIGLFDKDYFAYFEDTDLSHRIWLAGYSVIYCPKTSVYHIGGGAASRMQRQFIQFHSFKNRIITYIKNLSTRNLLRVLPLTFFLYQATVISCIIRGNWDVAFAIERSIIWTILHVEEIAKKRKYIQSHIRVVSDDMFLPKVTRHVRLSYYYYMFTGIKNYTD